MAADDTWDVLVGRRIAQARAGRGLTQRVFAAHLGWPHGTLANYERGRRRLSLDQLAQIAHALGRSPASFLVAAPTTARLLDQLADDEERAQQVAYFLATLDDPLPERP